MKDMIKGMFTRKSRLIRVLAIAGAASVFVLATATAAFKLRISDGTTTVLLTDQDFVPVAPDTDPDASNTVGNITIASKNIGVFNVTATAFSKPLIGGTKTPDMHLNSVHVAGGAGTLTIEATDTGFQPGAGSILHGEVGGSLTGIGATNSFDLWADPTNTEFGHGGAHVALGTFGPGVYAATGDALGVTGNPFSMTLQGVVTFGRDGGHGSFDMDGSVVPEGSSLALVLPGLLPLGLILRRRMKKA